MPARSAAAVTPEPALAPETEVEEMSFDSVPATPEGGVDTEALLREEGNWDASSLLGHDSHSLLPHEADPDFAPDANDISDESPFAKYLDRSIVPEDDADPLETESPVTTETTTTPVVDPVDAADPALAAIAAGLGMSVEELLGAAPEATPEAAPVEPTAPSPEVAALRAQLDSVEAQLAALTTQRVQESQTQALADQEAQVAADRASYEQAQRTAYEEQFYHLEDDARTELVSAKLEADMLRWDAQVGQRLAESRAQSQRQQEAFTQREQVYQATTASMVKANPTLATELEPGEGGKPGYLMADFLADTHRAAADAYGLDAVGEFEPYAKAFEAGIKTIQTKAFQAGIAAAQARASKAAAAPTVLSNKGGGAAPAAPKSGPAKIDLSTTNFFAPEGKTTLR